MDRGDDWANSAISERQRLKYKRCVVLHVEIGTGLA